VRRGPSGTLTGTPRHLTSDRATFPDRADGDGQPLRISGLHDDARRTDRFGQRPDAAADDRDADRQRLRHGQSGAVAECRLHVRQGACLKSRQVARIELRRESDEVGHARPAGVASNGRGVFVAVAGGARKYDHGRPGGRIHRTGSRPG